MSACIKTTEAVRPVPWSTLHSPLTTHHSHTRAQKLEFNTSPPSQTSPCIFSGSQHLSSRLSPQASSLHQHQSLISLPPLRPISSWPAALDVLLIACVISMYENCILFSVQLSCLTLRKCKTIEGRIGGYCDGFL